MIGMTLQPQLNAGMPRCNLSPTSTHRAAGATGERSSIVRPVALDRGNVLRIKNGRGTQICAASGVLWITEENSLEDHVLRPGDVLALVQLGLAIVLAHQKARVVVEVPAGVTPPRAIEMAMLDGEPGRRIVLAASAPISLHTVVDGLAAALGEAWTSIRTRAGILNLRWNFGPVSTSETYLPMLYSDGFPPKQVRRRIVPGARRVERVDVDDRIPRRI